MQYLVDNEYVGRIVRDKKSTRECYTTTLKATIPYLEYEIADTTCTGKGTL